MLALDDTPPGSSHRPQSVGAGGHHGGSSHRERERDRERERERDGAPASRERKRASHAPQGSASLRETDENQYPVRDVYSHPAALAYAAAHPRRNIPRFGPYLLLQTIGEGEFGKVKLGLHSQWGEEVAVKLIRRGSVDNTVRMSKVEREIDVLKTIRHPNIVRLYDVIETDKYIGIVLEYASGGELFDHILAHRCLKEKDACRLFAQVISGVAYIHAKKIVHRDLKLENLLLDRNRNVIISDFGFANRFEHRADDLMQTSCGSPCYAAPELVISEGMYVGSAVDIWSCGVILYAMLAGYLPFDDDPANPDGDNINLLYKYIINTPLTFPDYVSEDARDLLSKMLVPDPTRRADLNTIMNHHWLRAYKHFFDRTVEECEEAAVQQYEQKRLEYSRKLRSRMPEEEQRPRHRERATMADTSAPPSAFAASSAVLSESALSSYANHSMEVESAHSSSRRAQAVSAIVMPTQRRGSDRYQDASMMSLDQDSVIVDQRAVAAPIAVEEPAPKEKKSRKKAADRHTIQVEYDDPESLRAAARPPMPAPSPVADVFSAPSEHPPPVTNGRRASQPIVDSSTQQRSRMGSTPPVALSHAFAAPVVDEPRAQAISVTVTPSAEPKRSASVRTTNSKSRSRVSLTAIGKMLSPSSPSAPVPDSPAQSVESAQTQKAEQVSRTASLSVSQHSSARQTEDESTLDHSGDGGDSSFAKMRRRTLNLVVGGSRTEKKSSRQSKQVEKVQPSTAIEPSTSTLANGSFAGPPVGIPDPLGASGASTSKAKRVMDWFRSRSINRGRPDADVPVDIQALKASAGVPSTVSSATRPAPQLIVTTPHDASHDPLATPITPSAPSGGLSRVANSLVNTILPPRSVSSPAVSSQGAPSTTSAYALRIHHGAVDQGTVTTGLPPEVFAHVTNVLLSMGVEFHKETEFKYRCVRPKRRKVSAHPPPSPHKDVAGPQGVAAYTMVGSASLNGVDKRGLPQPPTISSTAGMLRGLLTRRASSHVSEPDEDGVRSTMSASRSVMGPQPLPGVNQDPLYGDRSQDLCDEVRFSVELTRIDRLDDTLSLDIRRLKGNLRSYKFLYDTLRDRCHFSA